MYILLIVMHLQCYRVKKRRHSIQNANEMENKFRDKGLICKHVSYAPITHHHYAVTLQKKEKFTLSIVGLDHQISIESTTPCFCKKSFLDVHYNLKIIKAFSENCMCSTFS